MQNADACAEVLFFSFFLLSFFYESSEGTAQPLGQKANRHCHNMPAEKAAAESMGNNGDDKV